MRPTNLITREIGSKAEHTTSTSEGVLGGNELEEQT